MKTAGISAVQTLNFIRAFSRPRDFGWAPCLMFMSFVLFSGCGVQIRALKKLSIGSATPTKNYELLVASAPFSPRNPEIELMRVPEGSFVTLLSEADASCVGGMEQEFFFTQTTNETHTFATLPITQNPFQIRARIQLPDHSLVCTDEVDLKFQLMQDVTAIAAGADHTCAVNDGVAFCWGNNDGGQLGDGARIYTHRWVLVET